MRRNAAVAGVLLGVVLSACAHHKTTTETAHQPEPAPATASAEPPALEPLPATVPTPAPAPVEQPALEPLRNTIVVPPPVIDPTLNQAASLAANGQPDQARRVYLALLNQANVSRQTIAEAARGLYRLGAFADAVEAFRNLGTFNRGEEDLRYYNAVSLFEIGHYDDAKKELACALPYIEVTSDVARYRDKIQKMGSPQAMK
jgi:Flp pilus assembly protein TadD